MEIASYKDNGWSCPPLKIYLIVILFLTQGIPLLAQHTYYVSAAGNDVNSGLSEAEPWQTLGKVNGEMASFQAGDQILFKRGETFHGSLLVTQDQLSFGAFGAGNKPVISGGVTFNSGWTSFMGNIWEKVLVQAPSELNNLYRENDRLPVGRFPNKDSIDGGFLRLESSSGVTQFTDNELGSSIDWTGADVVIRVSEFRYNRVEVTDHVGNTVFLGPGFDVASLQPNSGYYLINSIHALDSEGEWCYDRATGKIYLYSTANPNGTEFTYPFEEAVIEINSVSDISFSDIAVKFGNHFNVNAYGSENLSLDEVEISAAGGEGVKAENTAGVQIADSYFEEVNVRAVYVRNGTTGLVVHDNEFYNIGMDPAYGKEKGLFCIYNESNGAQFLRNKITLVGGAGIVTGGKNQLIKNNYLKDVVMLVDDMGGIYTNNNLGGLTTQGSVIEWNIVDNARGQLEGNHSGRNRAVGIYLDNGSNNVTVRNNSVFNCGATGYFLHWITGNTVFENNTAFGAGSAEAHVALQSADVSLAFNDNILVSTDSSGVHNNLYYTSSSLDVDESGSYAGNFIVNPLVTENIYIKNMDGNPNNSAVFDVHQLETNLQAFSNSSPTPIRVSGNIEESIRYYYNETLQPKATILPPGKFIDARNNYYCGEVDLEPFSSVVLFKYSEASCESPNVPVTVPDSLSVDQLSDIYCSLRWDSVAGAINYDLQFRNVSDTGWTILNNIQDNSFTLMGLAPINDYECQVRASGIDSNSNWSSSLLFTTLIEAECEVPANLAVRENLATSALLSWEKASVVNYCDIRYRPLGSPNWIEADSIAEPYFQLSGLVPETQYEWEIRSICQYGMSDWHQGSQFTTLQGAEIDIREASESNQWVTRTISNNSIGFNPHASVMLVGRSGDGVCGNAVFPFQLPDGSAIADLKEASFGILLDNVSPVASFAADLWGLSYRPTNLVSFEDYYDGNYSGTNQSSATKIENSFIDPVTTANAYHVTVTNVEGSHTLKQFITSQYQNGATGGEWIFLRISPRQATTTVRHWVDRAEDKEDGVPYIKLIYSSDSTNLPIAASQLSTHINSENTVTLNWVDNSDNEAGFIIERATSVEEFRAIDTLAPDVVSYVDSSAVSGNTYWYRVLSFNGNGVQGYSNISRSHILKMPETPGNLMAELHSDSIVKLAWVDFSSDETGFVIERKLDSLEFQVIDTVQADTTEYTDVINPQLGEYSYRIKAINENGSFGYSNVAIPVVIHPIHFVNANLNNVVPGTAISTQSSSGDNLWHYRTATNGTIDGNYIESRMQDGDNCPDISVIEEGILNSLNTYNVYLYYISPASQNWRILAKLPGDSTYKEYGRTTPGTELLNDNDGIPDRLYRILIGEVTGTADLQVDISDDLPSSVIRAAFDGIGYQLKSVGQPMEQQSITFAMLDTMLYGDGPLMLAATTTSGLPVSYTSSDPEVASVIDGVLTVYSTGIASITANQEGNATFAAANPVARALIVNEAMLNPDTGQHKIYGSAEPSLTPPIHVHRAVSPNGDGINEHLIIEAIGGHPENKVTVFNRNGTVMYEAGGYNNGTVAFRGVGNGQRRVPAGTYLYVAEFRVNGEWKHETGWFVLRY